MGVENQVSLKLSAESEKLLKRLGDINLGRLQGIFQQIGKDFRQEQKLFFSSKGTRRWPDLKLATKFRKRKLFGDEYPIMVASGRLAQSFYDAGHPENVSIIGAKSAKFGSVTPYAHWHEEAQENPSSGLPRRPLIISNDNMMLRWRRMLNSYFIKLFESAGIKVQGDIVV